MFKNKNNMNGNRILISVNQYSICFTVVTLLLLPFIASQNSFLMWMYKKKKCLIIIYKWLMYYNNCFVSVYTLSIAHTNDNVFGRVNESIIINAVRFRRRIWRWIVCSHSSGGLTIKIRPRYKNQTAPFLFNLNVEQ